MGCGGMPINDIRQFLGKTMMLENKNEDITKI